MEETYMKSGGVQCPFCGSADIIIGGTLETDTNLAWSSVSCGDCSGTWRDLYTLTGVDLGDLGEDL